ncbi:MAG: UDP-N-acetylmuramoyl-tripeptide--D-alanyl-D-alanine ligase [Firmicutes bacterium]|nr:UDP-N-acetylmuramoyl-tripeptide--D-alanyl-D-alanine ligase [Bacillota bacterium]
MGNEPQAAPGRAHPWSAGEIARACQGELIFGTEGLQGRGFAIDTRTLAGGEVFVPLQGEHQDGHRFLAEAFRRGASGCLVRKSWLAAGGVLPPMQPDQHFAVAVDEPLAALGRLAAYRRARLGALCVAVTGSNGKTTTKDMIAAILSRRYATASNVGNYNNEIGLPLTLANLEEPVERLVLEMGMRGPGQIAALAAIARPQVGAITTVSPVHLELLGSLEAIGRAKGELVEALPADGVAILNASNPWVWAQKKRVAARIWAFYEAQSAASAAGGRLTGGEASSPVGDLDGEGSSLGVERVIRAEDIRLRGVEGADFILRAGPGEWVQVHLAAPGLHNVNNALAAAAAALAAGADLEDVAAGLAQFRPGGMRLERVNLPGAVTLLNDSYNASPSSVAAALAVLAASPARRRIAILGDMLELGSQSPELHRRVGEKVAESGVDVLFALGPQCRHLAEAAARRMGAARVHYWPQYADAGALAQAVDELLAPGDWVLLKGSRGMRMERILERLQDRRGAPAPGPGAQE